VACRFIVPEVDGRAECLQGVFIAALDLLKSFAELEGTVGDHFFEMQAVVFHLLFEVPLVERTLEARKYGVFMKRFDKIVIGTTAHRLHAHIDVVHTRGDQEGDVRIGMANVCEELEASDTGHLEVGDDGIKAVALQSLEGFFAGASGGTAVSGRVQHKREKFAGGAFIVYGQDADGRRNGHTRNDLVLQRIRAVTGGHGRVRAAV
jgi:hypothetical protein